MKPFPLLVWLALGGLLPILSAPAQEASQLATSEGLAADTPRTTRDGNSFIAPAGWSLRTIGPAVILTAPEGGSSIALIDVAAAKDADAAVEAAWLVYDAKANWPIKRSSDRAKRDGWEQVRSYAYEVPASKERSISAQALRYGDRWTVALYDMANDVGEKRESQVDLVFQRLRPKGYQREILRWQDRTQTRRRRRRGAEAVRRGCAPAVRCARRGDRYRAGRQGAVCRRLRRA